MADGATQHGGDPDSSRGGTAAELMSWPVITIGLEAEVAKAARRLPKHVIRRMPVIDASGRLVGIVSHSTGGQVGQHEPGHQEMAAGPPGPGETAGRYHRAGIPEAAQSAPPAEG
jgi:hypothetical protein